MFGTNQALEFAGTKAAKHGATEKKISKDRTSGYELRQTLNKDIFSQQTGKNIRETNTVNNCSK